ncbi:MAG: hypothetical protein ACOYT4_00025 [Nanoarchaeota archaeon]
MQIENVIQELPFAEFMEKYGGMGIFRPAENPTLRIYSPRDQPSFNEAHIVIFRLTTGQPYANEGIFLSQDRKPLGHFFAGVNIGYFYIMGILNQGIKSLYKEALGIDPSNTHTTK